MQTSFQRANLTFRVVPKQYGVDDDGQPIHLSLLVEYINSKGDSSSGIVYCLSRKESESVAAYLDQIGGIAARHYHAGMTPKQRMEVSWRQCSTEADMMTWQRDAMRPFSYDSEGFSYAC